MTPSQIIHQIHGSPRLDSCAAGSGRCYVCGGEVLRGATVEAWMSSNYTDQNKARCPSSRFTCESCAFVMSRTAAVMGRPPKDGKQFGGNFRNYSHLWEAGAYSNASKGEKHVVRSFIERAHSGQWFAAIADSGQKHIIPWAPINGPGRSGRVMFDELQVDVPEDVSLISDMTAMLSGGATKDEIAIGSYRSATWATMGAAVAEFERAHQRLRGGAWFSLALWLAQREESDGSEKAGNTGGRSRARGAKGAPGRGRQRAQALDSARDGDAVGSAPDLDGDRVGIDATAPDAGRKPAGKRVKRSR